MTTMACDTTRRVPWPSELGFTRLTMLLRVAYADTPCDEDEEPDARAPQGTVILSWTAPWFRYRPSDGGPVQGWGAQSVECKILPDGTIAPPESTATSNGSVIVMPTVHELLEPSGSTITASIRLTTPGPKFQPISFQAKPGTTVNILAEADMGKRPGVIVKPVVTETTAERAEAAALRAETAATSAETAASSVEAGLVDLSDRVDWIERNGDDLWEGIDLNAPGDSYDIPSGWEVTYLRAGNDGAVLNTVYGERVLGPNQWVQESEWANELPLTGTLTLVSGSISYGTATYADRLYTPYSHLSHWDPHPEYAKTADLPPTRTGLGRPDTTGGNLTEYGDDPIGTEYHSEDGGGAGAWVWAKRPDGLRVVEGDTGWRDISSAGVAVRVRREGYMVHMILATGPIPPTETLVTPDIPLGFRSAGTPPLHHRCLGLLTRDTAEGSAVIYGSEPQGHGLTFVGPIAANSRLHVSYRTDDPWPTTLPGSALD